jgi:hypothetical protein
MKVITKKQLAEEMKISSGKLKTLLNKEWLSEIKPLGYKVNCHIISPKVYKFIVEAWGLDE